MFARSWTVDPPLNRDPQPLSRAPRRLLRLVVIVLIAAIVLLTMAQRLATTGPWWLELSRYLPYPALLLPAVVALMVSCWLGRWFRLASAAALALVATVTMGFEWHPAGGGTERIRVMTYNVKAYKAAKRSDGLAELAREVARWHPDILIMQDAGGLLPGVRSDPSDVRGPIFGLPQVYGAGQYVMASRFPLRDCAPGSMGLHGESHFFLHCAVDVDGVELNLVSIHLESPREGLNAARHEGLGGVAEWRRNYEERLAQARALALELKGRRRPLIVAGDFNAPEPSPVVQTLLAIGLRDAFSSAGRGYGYSYGHALRLGFSFLRIDHMLVSPELGVADCVVGESQGSDHRPVIADLRLRPSPLVPP